MRNDERRMAVRNGRVLLPDGEFKRCDILIEDGMIAQIGSGFAADRETNAEESYVLPGLVDLHSHGIGHERIGPGNLKEYARLLALRGTTSVYAGFFAPPEKSAEGMRRYRAETDELRDLPQVAGFRLESPYLAVTGAGSIESLAPITPDTTRLLLEAGGGHIKIWDVSPELAGAPELIQELSRLGIVCSIGHTSATIEQVRRAVDAGATLVTHMFDVFQVPTMTSPGVYPAGLTDYILVEDRLTCEIIADGTHVHPFHIEEAFRCKSPDRVAFVTDSNVGAGLLPGTYLLPVRGEKVLVSGPNDGVRLVDRGMCLSGSALTPIDSFRNAIRLFGRNIATASRVCSGTPARVMRLRRGEISVGNRADLLVLDSQLEIVTTIVSGRPV